MDSGARVEDTNVLGAFRRPLMELILGNRRPVSLGC
jgi:hypothetical protein